MLLHVQNHIEVAWRSAVSARFTEASKANASSVFYTSGNFCIDGSLPQHSSLTLALRAGISNHTAHALAGWAGTGHAEKSLLVADLAATATGPAWNRGLAGSRPCPSAFFAGLMAAHVYRGFGAKNCLFKFQRDVFAKIGAALCTGAAAGPSTKKVSEAEKVTEDFADILEDGWVEPSHASAIDSGVSVTVVGSTLIGVSQDGVGFAALFKFLFRVRVVGVAVRMKLQRQLAICAFDFLVAGLAGNSQHLVVIAFYVACQNGSESFRLAALVF